MATVFRVRLLMSTVLAFVPTVSIDAYGLPHDSHGNATRPSDLPLARAVTRKGSTRGIQSFVLWNGHKYDLDSGIEVLMEVIRDSQELADQRHAALLKLAMFQSQLRNRPCLDALVALYDKREELEQGGILTCFIASGDPRGIPLFVSVVDNKDNAYLRLIASHGLVIWNVRRGVAEIIDLFDSTELPLSHLRPTVGDRALDLFQMYNGRNGWGFPDEDVRGRATDGIDLDRDNFLRVYITEIKKWFAENEHRFPDWKPGDPLPEVEEHTEVPKSDHVDPVEVPTSTP